MKTGVLTTALAFAATFAFLSMAGVSGAGIGPDTDSDGFQDNIDNCDAVANPSQLDSDQDGYGQACDPDVDQNGTVGGSDFGEWKSALGTSTGDPGFNILVDFDNNGTVGGSDFGTWKSLLGGPPGTSGRSCASPTIDVKDIFGDDGTADADSVGCPDTRRRGTYTSNGGAFPTP